MLRSLLAAIFAPLWVLFGRLPPDTRPDAEARRRALRLARKLSRRNGWS